MGLRVVRQRQASNLGQHSRLPSPQVTRIRDWTRMRGMQRTPIVLSLLLFTALTACVECEVANTPAAPSVSIGRKANGSTVTPVNQTLTPHGETIELPGLRPQALAASMDGSRFYVSGKTPELLVVEANSGTIVQRVVFPAESRTAPSTGPILEHELHPDRSAQLSYTGLVVSTDGKWIFLSNVNGSIKVFRVAADGEVTPSHSIPLPPANAPRRAAEIPSGIALHPDGRRLLVCGNLSNTLLVLDLQSGEVLQTYEVGVAPFDVVLCGERAFVSNWGGGQPEPGDRIGDAGQGTKVRIDERGIASEGSVTIVNLSSGSTEELKTGLHASALAVSPDGQYVVVANAGSDNLSVIDSATGQWVETIWTKSSPSDLLGATPNALAFDSSGETLYVANGTQNAIAVIEFEPQQRGESHLLGMIPVGWFPGAVFHDASRERLVVANIKGLSRGRERAEPLGPEFNTHQYHGSLTLVPLPDDEELAELSEQVDINLRRGAIEAALAPPRPGRDPVAVPERIGEPSLIRHVVYVIKENRTFDQVLGDMPEANGDASLCIFGEQVTPNQHSLAREFVLLDNTYCSGILSADGHNWSTSAFGTDYLERSFAGWPRSYPDGMVEHGKDSLAYSPAGFLWDHAIAAGLTLRNFGEFCQPRVRYRDSTRTGEPDFMSCYRTWEGLSDEVIFGSEPTVPSLVPYSSTSYVGWNMSVPDQYRADVVLADLARCEVEGEFPNLTLICLPNDHTSGTASGAPTPAACMADGDLALGRIVEGLSRSTFWPQMAIFVIEDDPQAGWDHVSGYRTTAFVASPYARRGVQVGQQYNTTSVLRTIEQILGMPPMNHFDASASPMFECFTDVPDPTPFTALANVIPLDQLNPEASSLSDPVLRQDALTSAALDLSAMDRAPEDVLNRILWRSVRGTQEPYPEWAITTGVEDDDD
ncbi:MAG: YVTN family beta-propeller protein [Candidatus Paceibacteria bacterium]|jgi:YVTN family beta-propeller protein